MYDADGKIVSSRLSWGTRYVRSTETHHFGSMDRPTGGRIHLCLTLH